MEQKLQILEQQREDMGGGEADVLVLMGMVPPMIFASIIALLLAFDRTFTICAKKIVESSETTTFEGTTTEDGVTYEL
ncbi:hypothetical protein AB6A40_008893 [Gnathostoma spinigerum]|uniref:Uncharacterized protein n=1 Tax=Gnathostoma spinigerum TaxID=75299 RepID=A0ABD6EQD3_9BILA